jgi:hypothetical protein
MGFSSFGWRETRAWEILVVGGAGESICAKSSVRDPHTRFVRASLPWAKLQSGLV